MTEDAELIERLREASKVASTSTMLNGLTPEQTLAGQAAARLSALTAPVSETMGAGEKIMSDPTYEQDKIEANPVWHLAWSISEIVNDNAPIGWGRYIYISISRNACSTIGTSNAKPGRKA